MKTFYCVTTSVYDRGRVVASITDTKEAETRPENTSYERNDRDIYNDWYDSPEEARAAVKEAKGA
jgi:hypothetical protein